MGYLPTPAPVKYKADGQPNPPAPTINTDEFFKVCWPEMQLLAMKIKCLQSWYLQEIRLCKSLDFVMLFWHKSIHFFFLCTQSNLHHQDHDPKPPIFHLKALPHTYKSNPLPKGSYLILVTPAHLSAIWLCQPQLTIWTGPGHACEH